ncbi:pyrophosphate-energized vacuolar membrane proton pump 1-like isoform X3 [Daucus carota subsp. sativus]|uniref:pyrophosphate-energized vacuolar membrane proton pump 1-like isoform X3 n=1 Tax=Daucus carota subsp. sativus TaxID=79200 RepID=UPI00308392ED
MIDVADSCQTRAATNVFFDLALGYKSIIIPIFAIAIGIFISFSFAAMYGIVVAALGLLSTIATGLAMMHMIPLVTMLVAFRLLERYVYIFFCYQVVCIVLIQIGGDVLVLNNDNESVGKVALKMVEELRRQFYVVPGAFVMLTSPISVLAGALVSGVQIATSNTSGAWDNAKKYVEVHPLVLHFLNFYWNRLQIWIKCCLKPNGNINCSFSN